MAKKKQAKRKQQQRRQKRAESTKKRRQGKRAPGGGPGSEVDALLDELGPFFDFDPSGLAGGSPPRLDAPVTGTLPVLHLDPMGQVVPDPREVLGLPAGAVTEAQVRQAFRDRLLEHPPESDPAGAERLRDARDRLLSLDRVVERELLQVRLPDPAGLSVRTEASAERVDAEARLVGQALLYALVEDALEA